MYLPPNTYPLFPTVAQAWAALGNGLFPYVKTYTGEYCHAWCFLEYFSVVVFFFVFFTHFKAMEWVGRVHDVRLTVVTGWLHVDVSRSRMWMWLFQPRPEPSPCGSRPTCYIRASSSLQILSPENKTILDMKCLDISVFMQTGLLTPNEDNSSYS